MDMHTEISEFTTVSVIRQTGEAVRPGPNLAFGMTHVALAGVKWEVGCMLKLDLFTYRRLRACY